MYQGTAQLGAADPYPGQDPRAFTGPVTAFFSFWPAYFAGDINLDGSMTEQGKAKLAANLAAENPTVPVSQIEHDLSAQTTQYGIDPSQHQFYNPFDWTLPDGSSFDWKKIVVIGGLALAGILVVSNVLSRR